MTSKAKSKTPLKSASRGANGNGKRGLSNYRTQRANANKHTPIGLKELRASVQRDGIIGAITVARDGETFDGSARLETLAEAMPDVRIVEVETDGATLIVNKRKDIPNADDPRARRLGVAANVVAKLDYNPDGELLAALAAEDEAIASMVKAERDSLKAVEAFAMQDGKDAEPQIDRAEELRVKWGVELGQMWALGKHRLICGDCTDAAVVERVMGGEKADIVFTDPPYNVGKDYGKETNDNMTAEKYKNWSALWFTTCKSFSNAIVFTPGAVNVWMWAEIERPKWMAIWVKSNQVSRNGAGGFNTYEPILCYGKVKVDYDTWNIPVKLENVAHPVPKTVDAWQKILGDVLHEGITVYEPFSGSGTTIIACENLGRICRAVEISPAYVAVALQRYQDAFGKTPTLIEG